MSPSFDSNCIGINLSKVVLEQGILRNSIVDIIDKPVIGNLLSKVQKMFRVVKFNIEVCFFSCRN